jgi:hypothetical protein
MKSEFKWQFNGFVHPGFTTKGSSGKIGADVGEESRMEKRLRGRPKKKDDSIEVWQFGRAAIVVSAYDEARKKGEKHSAAVRDAVDAVRRRNPKVPISETGVKRILSTYRPRGSGTILHFDRSALSEEDIKKHRWFREQIAASQGGKCITLPELPLHDEMRPREKFMIGFSERPDYPRYNCKPPNE